MTTSVLICDDSSFARKQLARALPADWPVALSFAGHGQEALDAVRAGKGDVLFLDLKMPGLDGYQVLETIRGQDLPTLVIVISGDIQPEARARVCALAALEFMQKPLDDTALREVLARYGIHQSVTHKARNVDLVVDLLDGYREVANVAMGRAADRLARLLQAFVVMRVPRVAMLEAGELRMALGQFGPGEPAWGVCQGFVGAGVAGEALAIQEKGIKVIFTDRGGDVTYHGPGQLVIYPILNLHLHGLSVPGYVWKLEETVIRLLARYGIEAARAEKMRGVWVGKEKIAALGVHLSRWVSKHGQALNVNTNLDPFDLINPCGTGRRATSMARILGRELPMEEIETLMIQSFAEVFGVSISREPMEEPGVFL